MNINQAREEFQYLFSLPSRSQPSSWFSAFRTVIGRFPCCSVSAGDPETYLKTAGALTGLSNINTLALPFLLKDTYHLSPAGLGLMGALIAAPVFLKPGFAMMQGSRRRPFLVLAACGDFVARLGIGLLPGDGSQMLGLGGLLILGSTSVALDSITRDTLLIETMTSRRAPGAISSTDAIQGDSEEGGLIADVAGLASLTALSVAYFSGYLLQFTTPGHLILGSAVIPAFALINALRLDDTLITLAPLDSAASAEASPEGVSRDEQSATNFQKMGEMLEMLRRSPVLKSQLSASSISAIAPTFQDAMFYYYTDQLHLTPEFFGRWRLFGNLASLCANGLYRGLLKDVDQKTLAVVTQALIIPVIGGAFFVTTGSTEQIFGLSPAVFILARHAVFDGLSTLAAIANTVMLARVAPRGREGLFFAVYGLISDSTTVINGAVSSATTLAFGIRKGHFDNITNLVLFSSSLQVLVAPWTVWTPESVLPSAPEDDHELDDDLPSDEVLIVS